jgi:hypothetical protein
MKILLLKIIFITVVLLSVVAQTNSEVIPVEGTSNKVFDKGPTMTMLWEAESPKATVVVVMGGGGSIGINQNTIEIRNQTANMMRLLTKSKSSAPTLNIVVFDSPYDLQSGYERLAPRYSDDHLTRIESVVKFYRQKFNHPVWLMGHSNGGVSVSEFINRSDENRKLISGAILSGSRNQSSISKSIDFPVLVIHHKNDGCISARFDLANRHYEKIKSLNNNLTEFKSVGGGVEFGDPCTNGYHMYREAYPEASNLIRDFIIKSMPLTSINN